MTSWYEKTIEQTYKELDSRPDGLSMEEARERLEMYGPNSLPVKEPDSLAKIFFRQFKSPLIYILFAAAVTVWALGEFTDAVIIFLVLLFNAVVGSVQEGRAQNTLLALRKFVETKAVVIRKGEEIIIPDTEVVPGDLLVLSEGEKISADCRIIESSSLKVDEAALTGESVPVEKIVNAIAPVQEKMLQVAEQNNMVFKGTFIVSGNGKATAVKTGVKTIIGEISEKISTTDQEAPLKANIRHLSNAIIVAVACISLALFVLGLLYGNSASDMFATVISLAVSIIPEGLPVALTLILANGVWRMGKRNALVKKLQSVEALGQARVIAVDKTGTITKNELVVKKIYCNGKIFEVTGDGYEPKGDILFQNQVLSPLEFPELILAGKIAILSAQARLAFSEESTRWVISGDPTEAAILVLGEKIGFKQEDEHKRHALLQEIAFDYKTQFHATVRRENTKAMLSVVGSPESVMKLAQISPEASKGIEIVINEFSSQGLRVLGFGFAEVIGMVDPSSLPKIVFAGLFAMEDTLHPEVKDAVAKVKGAGVKVVMITGDHKITAEAIAREAGIFKNGDKILTGADIDNLSEQELVKSLDGVSVFARVTPDDKLRIVQAYRKRGEVVAMTGDGVNDAPSLVAADLGVAMGRTGTEVAKAAADIILLDDNFSSIVSAVEEGRGIYRSIQRVLLYLFSTSLGELGVIAGAVLLGYALPILPVQIIWLNFVTDGFLTVALVMQSREKGLLEGKFPKPNKYLVDKLMVERMFLMGTAMVISTLWLYKFYTVLDPVKATTVAVTVLAVVQWFNAWNCKSTTKSVIVTNPFSDKFLLLATLLVALLQLAAVYTSSLGNLLHLVPLNVQDWYHILAVSTLVIIVEEIPKTYMRIRRSTRIN